MKGVLFSDYVRMIRGNKSVDWSNDLEASDLPYLKEKIDPEGWYPMESFERMGNAILREVAKDDLNAVRMWGRMSVDLLNYTTPGLLAEGDPVETLMRFRVLRSTFFDFDALEVATLTEGHAHVVIHYFMGDAAEQAASWQTLGFFERLLELAGAKNVHAHFKTRSWDKGVETLLEIDWSSED